MPDSGRTEYGDFQTPAALARRVCEIVRCSGFEPASVLEPTCGRGAFLQAAFEAFPRAARFLAMDVNPQYVHAAQASVPADLRERVEVREGDFFLSDWEAILAGLGEPILIVGNPPWVTNAVLGSLNSANLPAKSNAGRVRGIEAITGASNFDISEWMLRQGLEWLACRRGMLAVLCKTSVARKLLAFAWSEGLPVASASLYRIDAKLHFGASVDACLLVVLIEPGGQSKECGDCASLEAPQPQVSFGFRSGQLVADVVLYERWNHLYSPGLNGWRSGIKHDCAGVFELTQRGDVFLNGLGEEVTVEQELVFPLLKSSDLAGRQGHRRWLLVPQRSMSESPAALQREAPAAWRYLSKHARALGHRASSIYRNRPPFSIFGVGPYSFSPWKVAISGLYKKLEFVPVGPIAGKPVVLDDTCYFFACRSKAECQLLHSLVSSRAAREFWSSFVFWDSKRPITARLLNMLDLSALAEANGVGRDAVCSLAERQVVGYSEADEQLLLFHESSPSYGGIGADNG